MFYYHNFFNVYFRFHLMASTCIQNRKAHMAYMCLIKDKCGFVYNVYAFVIQKVITLSEPMLNIAHTNKHAYIPVNVAQLKLFLLVLFSIFLSFFLFFCCSNISKVFIVQQPVSQPSLSHSLAYTDVGCIKCSSSILIALTGQTLEQTIYQEEKCKIHDGIHHNAKDEKFMFRKRKNNTKILSLE